MRLKEIPEIEVRNEVSEVDIFTEEWMKEWMYVHLGTDWFTEGIVCSGLWGSDQL